jgi:hypothetical protein
VLFEFEPEINEESGVNLTPWWRMRWLRTGSWTVRATFFSHDEIMMLLLHMMKL